MKVKFINASEIAEEMKIAGWTASVSYDSKSDPEKIARHCIGAGHGTPSRPMRFMFEISEVSRAFSHEFVRHEIGVAKVQRSQRYVKEDGFGYVTPTVYQGYYDAEQDKIVIPAIPIPFLDGMMLTFEQLQVIIEQFYSGSLQAGVKPEDARYALTSATHTKIHVSFDWEGLTQFCYRRCCTRAQWEIRAVAVEIKRLVTEAYPFLGEKLGAHCHVHGYCPELPSGCGIAPSRKELLQQAKVGRVFIDKYGLAELIEDEPI